MGKKKKRQHYVWRNYLKPWITEDKIFCLRENKIFSTSLMNIGQENYFYKLEQMNSEDLSLLYELFIKDLNPDYQKLNDKWAQRLNFIFEIKNDIEKQKEVNKELCNRLETLTYNLLEDLHSNIESKSVKYLNSLKNTDISFMDDDNEASNFFIYLSMQYFRAKKWKIHFQKISSTTQYDIKRIWNVASLIMSTSLAFSLFIRRNELSITFFTNETENFIAGDLPLINSKASYPNQKALTIEDFELFYPLTPNLAILISISTQKLKVNKISVSDGMVRTYNEKIFSASHEQIYAKTEIDLKKFCCV